MANSYVNCIDSYSKVRLRQYLQGKKCADMWSYFTKGFGIQRQNFSNAHYWESLKCEIVIDYLGIHDFWRFFWGKRQFWEDLTEQFFPFLTKWHLDPDQKRAFVPSSKISKCFPIVFHLILRAVFVLQARTLRFALCNVIKWLQNSMYLCWSMSFFIKYETITQPYTLFWAYIASKYKLSKCGLDNESQNQF